MRTFVCIYLLICTCSTQAQSQKNKTPMGYEILYFQSMDQLKLVWKHSNNGLYLSKRLQKLDFSILVNISLFIVFCKCFHSNNISSKRQVTLLLLLQDVKASYHVLLWFGTSTCRYPELHLDNTLSIQPQMHSSVAERTDLCRGQVIFVSFQCKFYLRLCQDECIS